MNKIKTKDWAMCLLHHNFDYCKVGNMGIRPTGAYGLRCPDKATGDRPANCPLPVTIEFEKEPMPYDEKEHGTLPIL